MPNWKTRLTDFLHKLSTEIINENQVIVLEDLNVSGMVKNRKLSRAISDLGWRQFRTFLEGKAEKYGRDFRVISRWEPTSQKCSCCGFSAGKLDLSVREWECFNCGAKHDRSGKCSHKYISRGRTAQDIKRTWRPASPTPIPSREGSKRGGCSSLWNVNPSRSYGSVGIPVRLRRGGCQILISVM